MKLTLVVAELVAVALVEHDRAGLLRGGEGAGGGGHDGVVAARARVDRNVLVVVRALAVDENRVVRVPDESRDNGRVGGELLEAVVRVGVIDRQRVGQSHGVASTLDRGRLDSVVRDVGDGGGEVVGPGVGRQHARLAVLGRNEGGLALCDGGGGADGGALVEGSARRAGQLVGSEERSILAGGNLTGGAGL